MISISFDKPYLPQKVLMKLTYKDLDESFMALHKSKKYSEDDLYFVLLTTFFRFESKKNFKAAAHAAYLISYYIFVLMTPPGSEFLAKKYIDIAISLNPIGCYIDWKAIVKQGN